MSVYGENNQSKGFEQDNALDLNEDNRLTLKNAEISSCPYCGETVFLTTVYCPSCGKDVMQNNNHKPVKRLMCPHCNTPNDLGNNQCSYCFFDLTFADMQEFRLEYMESARQNNAPIVQAVLKAGSTADKLCANCNTLNYPAEVFCAKCGMELLITMPARYCLSCGAKNESDARYCINCQKPFDSTEEVDIDQTWACQCGRLNDESAAFCIECGTEKPVPKGNKKKK